MRPGCFCVLVCGIGFAKAVQALEDGGAKISWNTFKECGTLFPPEIEHVFRYIQTKAANIPELKKLIFTLRLNELWSQCFMNPNIPETVLHSTRSMLHTYAHLLRCPHVCFTHVGKPLPACSVFPETEKNMITARNQFPASYVTFSRGSWRWKVSQPWISKEVSLCRSYCAIHPHAERDRVHISPPSASVPSHVLSTDGAEGPTVEQDW